MKKLEHILYVDDDIYIQEVAQICLEMMAGFRVTCLGSGREVLSKLEAINPDLILLDVMMPVMDGPTTLEGLRKNPAFDHIPVVFITARAQPQEVAQYLELGATGVVIKPFDPMTISDQIQEIWERFNASR